MKEQIIQLRKEGKTYNQIQKLLGCSKGTISYHCGKGQIAKSLKRKQTKRERNKKYVNDLKKKSNCFNCQEDRWWVLEFHHLERLEKKDNISKLIRNHSIEEIQKEIDKCVIVCANCHKDIHYKMRNETK